ncbi:VOC family protein [Clavibacter michiganensis subsp. michiganensis]|uniref:VOC family protein n=1 Tax=Clavibacter michiganensis TaxID=28447 RepID=UPI0013659BEC|nr:VOC family protein [Clavibacter michiganensis]MWJ25166.1 VOC family protein [Clavibacter michiganensis subsp. michiganensis]MWJ84527.1 VOC family protein [Clavibacter michiganensis subsp. michiganensis]
MPRITPTLWFGEEIEEAARFYIDLFPDPALRGTALVVDLELDGQGIRLLNGGPGMQATEAVSLSISAATQEEVDRYWDAFADGGTEGRCGWVRDRWGFWWQVVPEAMASTIGGPDPAGAARAMAAMMGMGRLVVAELQAAYDGR